MVLIKTTTNQKLWSLSLSSWSLNPTPSFLESQVHESVAVILDLDQFLKSSGIDPIRYPTPFNKSGIFTSYFQLRFICPTFSICFTFKRFGKCWVSFDTDYWLPFVIMDTYVWYDFRPFILRPYCVPMKELCLELEREKGIEPST